MARRRAAGTAPGPPAALRFWPLAAAATTEPLSWSHGPGAGGPRHRRRRRDRRDGHITVIAQSALALIPGPRPRGPGHRRPRRRHYRAWDDPGGGPAASATRPRPGRGAAAARRLPSPRQQISVFKFKLSQSRHSQFKYNNGLGMTQYWSRSFVRVNWLAPDRRRGRPIPGARGRGTSLG